MSQQSKPPLAPGDPGPITPGEVLRAVSGWAGRHGCMIWGLLALIALGGLSQCGESDPAPGAGKAGVQSAQPIASAAKRQQCRDYLDLARREGLIRGRPSPDRLDVDERIWTQLSYREKDITLQAVSCDLWGTDMPGEGNHVAAYGWHSGKRLQMLTALGMARE